MAKTGRKMPRRSIPTVRVNFSISTTSNDALNHVADVAGVAASAVVEALINHIILQKDPPLEIVVAVPEWPDRVGVYKREADRAAREAFNEATRRKSETWAGRLNLTPEELAALTPAPLPPPPPSPPRTPAPSSPSRTAPGQMPWRPTPATVPLNDAYPPGERLFAEPGTLPHVNIVVPDAPPVVDPYPPPPPHLTPTPLWARTREMLRAKHAGVLSYYGVMGDEALYAAWRGDGTHEPSGVPVTVTPRASVVVTLVMSACNEDDIYIDIDGQDTSEYTDMHYPALAHLPVVLTRLGF